MNTIEITAESKDKTKFDIVERKIKRSADVIKTTGEKAGKDLADSLEKGAKKAADAVEDAGTKAGKGLADGVKKGSDDAAGEAQQGGSKVGAGFLANIKEFTKHVKDEFKRVGENAKGMASEIAAKAKSGGGKLKSAGMAMGKVLAAGVLLAVGTVGAGLINAMGFEAANDELAGQLSLSVEGAKKAGEAASNVYKQNWGESIGDVNDAIKSIGQNLVSVNQVSKSELESMTTQALTLRDAFGVEVVDSTRAVGQMIKTGMAKNAKEGFDLITAGEQMGLDKAGDLIDTFNEYGTQFRKLGIDGPYALSLINAAIQAGARDSDIAADAIKEFSIRAVDGSKLTAQGFKAAGLDADKMSAAISKGGPTAQAAFRQTLQAVMSIKDPIKQNAAGVALFGTQWEDMGPKVMGAMSKADTALEEVDGATKKLGDTMGNNLTTKIESAKRAGEAWANSKLLPVVEQISDRFTDDFLPALQTIGSFMRDTLGPVVKEFAEKWLSAVKRNLDDIKAAFEDNRPQLELFGEALKKIAPVIGTVLVVGVEVLGASIEALIRTIGFCVDAFLLLKEGIGKAVAAAMPVIGKLVTGFIGGIGMMINALLPYAKSMDKVFHTNTAQWVESQRNAMLQMAQDASDAFDQIATDAQEMADAASRERVLIKLKGDKQDIQSKIDDVKRRLKNPNLTNPQKSKLRADLSRLRADLIQAQAAINRLKGKTVTLRTNREIYTYRYDSTKSKRGRQYEEHGGISTAATGGPRGRETLTGEAGMELLDLPPGTMVHSNPDTERILGERARQGQGDIFVTVMVGTERLGQLLIRPLRNEVRALGGNVQAVLGGGRA
jgi:hypothetical protein